MWPFRSGPKHEHKWEVYDLKVGTVTKAGWGESGNHYYYTGETITRIYYRCTDCLKTVAADAPGRYPDPRAQAQPKTS